MSRREKKMIKIVEWLEKGNQIFQWKLMQNLERVNVKEKIPKFPILILTCMDPRIDVHKIFQLDIGDVFVIRNAGNVFSKDVLRSILIAIHEYQIRHIIVLGHLDCGMTKIQVSKLRDKFSNAFVYSISENNDSITGVRKFLKVFNDEIRNVNKQLDILRKSPRIPDDVEITGMIYDPATGWVFNEDIMDRCQNTDSLMRNYKTILAKKKEQLTSFLRTMDLDDSQEITEDIEVYDFIDVKHEDTQNDLNCEETPDGEKIDLLEVLKQKTEMFNSLQDQKIFDMVKIRVPRIYFPKINVRVPAIYIRSKNEAS